MKKYTKVRSTCKPKQIFIDDIFLWESSNICKVSEEDFSGYEYDLYQYKKDEYINLQLENQKILNDRINNTQVALCEIYESMEGVK